MGYTREGLELAIANIVESMGGVRHLFSNHLLQVENRDLDRFEAQWPTLPIESRVGKIASIIGSSRLGDYGVVTDAYRDLCTKRALQFAIAA